MPTEYDYEITPRTLGLGGGWNLRLLENGEEVGGVFSPCRNTAIFGMKRRSRRYSIASMRTP